MVPRFSCNNPMLSALSQKRSSEVPERAVQPLNKSNMLHTKDRGLPRDYVLFWNHKQLASRLMVDELYQSKNLHSRMSGDL